MVTAPRWSRRTFLAAAAGAVAAGSLRAATAPRIAAVDWAMAETATLLGYAPVALAELVAFRRTAPQPVPRTTVDLGLRGAPNLESLALVAPDLILSSSYYTFVEPQLTRIAPVFSRPLFVPGERPLPKMFTLLDELADAIGDPAAARATRRSVAADIDELAARLAPHAGRPVLLVEIGDPRHVRVFGTDSLFHGALTAVGLRNAWSDGTRFSFAAPVPMSDLARFPDAHIVIMGDMPAQVEHSLGRSRLWNALPAVKAGRVTRLPDLNGFGGLPSALNFARTLADGLAAS